MLKRFLGFLVLATLLGAFGALFYLNPAAVEFRLSRTRSYSLPLPLLLLLAFSLGAALVFLLALVRETQWTLADRRRRRIERRLERRRAAAAEGRELLWHGHPERARVVLRRAGAGTDGVEPAVLLAETALENDRDDEAKALLDESLGRHPSDPRLLHLLSDVHQRRGDPREATSALEQAVARRPTSPRLVRALRDSYVTEGRWSDAVRAEESLLSLLRRPEEVLREQPLLRGLRYEAALVVEPAEAKANELRAVAAGEPTFLPAAVSLGDVLRRLGRSNEAARVWIRAARRRPEPVLLSRLESLYRDLGRPKKTIALYRRLLRRFGSPALSLGLVRFLLSEGSIDEAAAELEKTKARAPEDPDLQVLSGEVARLRGHAEIALQAFRTALDPTAAARRMHTCRACERTLAHWASRCPGCGAWDSLTAA